MSKYQNGKIYKITDLGYNKCYIGSTCESLCKRMGRHRREYKQYCNANSKRKSFPRSMSLFDEYGVENCKIELIEDYPTDKREDLLKREGFYIKNIDCLNKIVSGRTKKEYYDDTREHQLEHKKQHRLDNIEQYKAKDKAYLEKNKENINARQRQTYQEHRDERIEAMRKYREEHREQIRQQQRERYERDKDESNRRRRERRLILKQATVHDAYSAY